MKINWTHVGLSFFVAASALSPMRAFADDSPQANSRRNKDIVESEKVTADDQGAGASDVALAAKIRKAMVNNKDLSLSAKNAKVVVIKGTVFLKGPVETLAERAAIAGIAGRFAGRSHVRNEIEVKAAH